MGALLTPHCLPDVGARSPRFWVLSLPPPMASPWLLLLAALTSASGRPGRTAAPWESREDRGGSMTLGGRPAGPQGSRASPGPSTPASALGPGRASPGWAGGGLHSSRPPLSLGHGHPPPRSSSGARSVHRPAPRLPFPQHRRCQHLWGQCGELRQGAVGLCSPGIQASLGRCGHRLVCRGQTS